MSRPGDPIMPTSKVWGRLGETDPFMAPVQIEIENAIRDEMADALLALGVNPVTILMASVLLRHGHD